VLACLDPLSTLAGLRIRTAVLAAAASLIELWAAGLKLHPPDVAG
jgi:hypothetical protein